jgi:hypothetical protein
VSDFTPRGPDRRGLCAAEAAELAARARMLLRRVADVTDDADPVLKVAAAASLLDRAADRIDAADAYTVTHARCGRPHAPLTPCPVAVSS